MKPGDPTPGDPLGIMPIFSEYCAAKAIQIEEILSHEGIPTRIRGHLENRMLEYEAMGRRSIEGGING